MLVASSKFHTKFSIIYPSKTCLLKCHIDDISWSLSPVWILHEYVIYSSEIKGFVHQKWEKYCLTISVSLFSTTWFSFHWQYNEYVQVPGETTANQSNGRSESESELLVFPLSMGWTVQSIFILLFNNIFLQIKNENWFHICLFF